MKTIDLYDDREILKNQFNVYKKTFVPRRPRKTRGNSIPSLDEESQRIDHSSNR